MVDPVNRLLATCVVALSLALAPHARVSAQVAPAVEYRLSFPEPEHHWMQVEATFAGLGAGPVDLRMSRSSPGRYSLHDFAKNVYDVQVTDADGRPVPASQPDPYGWRVERHNGSLTVRYRVFGDRVDGTYLAVDPTHAHINMPAALMFVRGLDDRPARVIFTPPPGHDGWTVATQLMPGPTPLQFAAPNLQYLMDSPAEFGPVALHTFVVDGHTFRFAAHHDGTTDELARYVDDVRAIVTEQRTIYGEYPTYEPGYYTFLADYLPYANGDGMEHRNSTVITAAGSIRNDRLRLLGTAAHEFFHNWNVERIRPRSLEPFNFEAANLSNELWLAEGFTQYYGPLTLSRTGLADLRATAATWAGFINTVALNPARLVRSADAMSRMAAFTDGGRTIDRTNWSTTYISYYPYGGAIALALDLTLRERFDGRLTLDDFMRAMWRTYGRPGGSRPGYVDRPYTLADVERTLADVTGNAAFAREFFARYVTGHEAADYTHLLDLAGLVVRQQRATVAWIGDAQYDAGARGLRIESSTITGSPLFTAGLDRGNEIVEVDGQRIQSSADLSRLVAGHKPGDALRATIADRAGVTRTVTITTASDPAVEVVPVESLGRTPTEAQRTFRQRWLASRTAR